MRCDMFPRVIQLNRIRHACASICRRFIFVAEEPHYTLKVYRFAQTGNQVCEKVDKTADGFCESPGGLCESKVGKADRHIWPYGSGRNPVQ